MWRFRCRISALDHISVPLIPGCDPMVPVADPYAPGRDPSAPLSSALSTDGRITGPSPDFPQTRSGSVFGNVGTVADSEPPPPTPCPLSPGVGFWASPVQSSVEPRSDFASRRMRRSTIGRRCQTVTRCLRLPLSVADGSATSCLACPAWSSWISSGALISRGRALSAS